MGSDGYFVGCTFSQKDGMIASNYLLLFYSGFVGNGMEYTES